jgi:TolB-like protein/Tfp pilus assembly protein PilF
MVVTARTASLHGEARGRAGRALEGGVLTRNGPEGEAGPDAGGQGGAADDRLPPEEVRAQLRRILNSPAFEASKRRRRFLSYIVDESLAGRADRLKGYSIATAVFERDDSFDPQTDPVVRLEARRLRRALEHYYLTAGRDDPIRIEIPKGGYAPICERQAATPAEAFTDMSAGGGRPPEAQPVPRSQARFLGYQLPASGIAFVLGATLAVAAGVAWLWSGRAAPDQSVGQAAADARSEEPDVIVLPFANLTGTAGDDRFAEGLAEELISNLTRFDDLHVYSARDDLYEQGPPEVAGARPDARYMVKGSVRRMAGGMRATVHLIDFGSGRYLWSETYERSLTDDNSVALQKALGAELASQLAEPYGVLRQVTAHVAGQGRPEILRTYDCVSQAYAYRRTFRSDVFQSTRDCLEEAVRRDPSHPDAWAMLAFTFLDEYRWYGLGPRYRQQEALDRAYAAAERARELDRDHALSLTAYATVQFHRGNLDEAEAAQRRAIALNPNNPEALVQLGFRTAFTRDWEAGMSLVRQAIERSRAKDGWYYILLAIDDYRHGDCRQALADVARVGGTFFFVSPALVAMCQAQLGNQKEAREALKEALALDPTFAQDPRGAFRLHRVPEDMIDRFMTGLAKAGLEDPGV